MLSDPLSHFLHRWTTSAVLFGGLRFRCLRPAAQPTYLFLSLITSWPIPVQAHSWVGFRGPCVVLLANVPHYDIHTSFARGTSKHSLQQRLSTDCASIEKLRRGR
jgi:hypothetical protein